MEPTWVERVAEFFSGGGGSKQEEQAIQSYGFRGIGFVRPENYENGRRNFGAIIINSPIRQMGDCRCQDVGMRGLSGIGQLAQPYPVGVMPPGKADKKIVLQQEIDNQINNLEPKIRWISGFTVDVIKLILQKLRVRVYQFRDGRTNLWSALRDSFVVDRGGILGVRDVWEADLNSEQQARLRNFAQNFERMRGSEIARGVQILFEILKEKAGVR